MYLWKYTFSIDHKLLPNSVPLLLPFSKQYLPDTEYGRLCINERGRYKFIMSHIFEMKAVGGGGG